MKLKPLPLHEKDYRKNYSKYSKHYEAFKLIDNAIKEMRLPDIEYISQGKIKLIKIEKREGTDINIIFQLTDVSGWGVYADYIRIHVDSRLFFDNFPRVLRGKLSYSIGEFLLTNYTYLQYQLKWDRWGSYTYRSIFYGNDTKRFEITNYKNNNKDDDYY